MDANNIPSGSVITNINLADKLTYTPESLKNFVELDDDFVTSSLLAPKSVARKINGTHSYETVTDTNRLTKKDIINQIGISHLPYNLTWTSVEAVLTTHQFKDDIFSGMLTLVPHNGTLTDNRKASLAKRFGVDIEVINSGAVTTLGEVKTVDDKPYDLVLILPQDLHLTTQINNAPTQTPNKNTDTPPQTVAPVSATNANDPAPVTSVQANVNTAQQVNQQPVFTDSEDGLTATLADLKRVNNEQSKALMDFLTTSFGRLSNILNDGFKMTSTNNDEMLTAPTEKTAYTVTDKTIKTNLDVLMSQTNVNLDKNTLNYLFDRLKMHDVNQPLNQVTDFLQALIDMSNSSIANNPDELKHYVKCACIAFLNM